MNFADIDKRGFIPLYLYQRQKITDDLHEVCGFATDFQFVSKQKMKHIEKLSKGRYITTF